MTSSRIRALVASSLAILAGAWLILALSHAARDPSLDASRDVFEGAPAADEQRGVDADAASDREAKSARRAAQADLVSERRWRLVSRRDGSAIRAATLRISALAKQGARAARKVGGAPIFEFELGEDGDTWLRVRVPESLARQRCHLSIDAPGFVPLDLACALPPRDAVLALDEAGSVEVRVSSQQPGAGGGAGARIVILPPTLDGPKLVDAWQQELRVHLAREIPVAVGRWVEDVHGLRAVVGSVRFAGRSVDGLLHAWMRERCVRRSDAHGGVRFDGLPRLAGYRVCVLGRKPVRIDPPHENRHLIAAEKGVQAGAAPVRAMSGAIDLEASATVRVHVERLTAAAIRGHFAPSMQARQILPQVKLYVVDRVRAHDGREATSMRQVDFVVARASGGFEFRDVAPGEYVVRSWWQIGERDLYFTSTGVRVLRSDVDLGRIDATRGTQLAVRVRVQSSSGRTLSREELFTSKEWPYAFLVAETIPDSRDAADSLFESIAVRPDRDYVLHGLRPGRLQLRPSGDLWASKVRDGVEVSIAHQATKIERVGASPSLLLPLVVHVAKRQLVEAQWPAGVEHSGLRVWARSGEQTRELDASITVHKDATQRGRIGFALADADEELLVSMPARRADSSGAFLRLRAEVVREGGGVVRTLRAGVRIRGRLLDGQGARALTWRPRGWGSEGLFDDDDPDARRFDVSGLPTELDLLCSTRAAGVPAQARGGLVTRDLLR